MKLTLRTVLALALVVPAAAQEIGVFGGPQIWNLWRSKAPQPGSDLANGGLWGVRVGQDITSRFGLEGSYGYGVNNLRLFPDQRTRPGNALTPREAGFGSRNHHLSVNPVYHFTDSGSAIRPYVTAGIGSLWYRITDDGRRDGRLPINSFLGAGGLDGKFGPAFNWGGGIKAAVGRGLQLRFDARNVQTRNPHFNLPDTPLAPGGAFIAPKGVQSGWQATAGLGFSLGSRLLGAGAPDKKPEAGRDLTVKLSGDDSPMKLGAARSFQARTNAVSGTPVTYQWSIKSPTTETIVRDLTGPEFAFETKDRIPGAYKIQVTASSPNYTQPATDSLSLRVLPPDSIPLSLSADPSTINPGQTSNAAARADLPSNGNVKYSWTVNGQTVEGANGPNYIFASKGHAPGSYEICVTAEAAGYTASRACTTVVIRECGKPTLSLTQPSPGEIWRGDRATVPANAQPGNCGGPVTVSYRASEGVIGPDGAFDSSDVTFDMANRSTLQRKNVTITATATDTQGATATAQTGVVVRLAPVAQRLDDILFTSGGARVNNCGKRLLLEVLAPKLQQDPGARVLLIGHVDEKEPGAKAKTRALDRARVLSVAAVVSAGQGICPSLELSRVKVGLAGTIPSSDPKPNFCANSTERRGQGVAQSDRAPFRSVEVWLIPSGAAVPSGVAVLDAPEAEIRKLGCPK